MTLPDPKQDPAAHWGGGGGPGRRLSLTLPLVLLILTVWTGVTILGGFSVAEGESDVNKIMGEGIAWNVAGAAVFAMLVGRLVGLWPQWFAGTLPAVARAFWLPLLYLCGIGALVLSAGLPAGGVMLVILVNCLLVGLSEEVMFRGLLYRALRNRLGIAGSVWISSGVFGAVHVLNALMTGNLAEALVQSVFAAGLGMVLAAMMLRSGSLVWPVMYHGLWDFGVILVGRASQAAPSMAPPEPGLAMVLPVVMVLPNVIFALWLIRRLPRHPGALARA